MYLQAWHKYRQNHPFPIKITWGFIGNGRNVSICEQAWAWPGIILDGDLARVGRGAGGLVAEGWGKTGWADAAGKVCQGWWPTAVVQVLGETGVVVILFFRYRLANRSQCQLTTAPLECVGDV